MDKKAKKRIEVLQPKLQKLRMQLAGAKKQMDDIQEVRKLESEIAAIEAELKHLKAS
jgi:type II secretory pathway component PulM